jgi:hypothetical protein
MCQTCSSASTLILYADDGRVELDIPAITFCWLTDSLEAGLIVLKFENLSGHSPLWLGRVHGQDKRGRSTARSYVINCLESVWRDMHAQI